MLSKSRIIRGYQCKKSLFLHAKNPELKADLTNQQQMIFDMGANVGKLACQLFPNVKYGTPEGGIPDENAVQNTTNLIANGEKIIYEATFVNDDVLVASDI